MLDELYWQERQEQLLRAPRLGSKQLLEVLQTCAYSEEFHDPAAMQVGVCLDCGVCVFNRKTQMVLGGLVFWYRKACGDELYWQERQEELLQAPKLAGPTSKWT